MLPQSQNCCDKSRLVNLDDPNFCRVAPDPSLVHPLSQQTWRLSSLCLIFVTEVVLVRLSPQAPQFNSAEFSSRWLASMRSENPICDSPRLSLSLRQFPPMLPLKQFQRSSDCPWLLFPSCQGSPDLNGNHQPRLEWDPQIEMYVSVFDIYLSVHASLLQAIDGVISVVLGRSSLVESCFTSTETVSLLGTGAQDGHLDFHTAPELCPAGRAVCPLNTSTYETR